MSDKYEQHTDDLYLGNGYTVYVQVAGGRVYCKHDIPICKNYDPILGDKMRRGIATPNSGNGNDPDAGTDVPTQSVPVGPDDDEDERLEELRRKFTEDWDRFAP